MNGHRFWFNSGRNIEDTQHANCMQICLKVCFCAKTISWSSQPSNIKNAKHHQISLIAIGNFQSWKFYLK